MTCLNFTRVCVCDWGWGRGDWLSIHRQTHPHSDQNAKLRRMPRLHARPRRMAERCIAHKRRGRLPLILSDGENMISNIQSGWLPLHLPVKRIPMAFGRVGVAWNTAAPTR